MIYHGSMDLYKLTFNNFVLDEWATLLELLENNNDNDDKDGGDSLLEALAKLNGYELVPATASRHKESPSLNSGWWQRSINSYDTDSSGSPQWLDELYRSI